MAEEIQIPIMLSAHRVNNANAAWDHLTLTNNTRMEAGWRCRDDEIADINGRLTRPIPSNINGTPAGKVRLHWVTASSSTNNCKWFVYLVDGAYNTDTVDPAAWDDSLTVIDANNGAGIPNECDVTISSATLTSGRGVWLLFRRDATVGESQDTLAADVLLTDALLIADEA
jgi:hypothetical protein